MLIFKASDQLIALTEECLIPVEDEEVQAFLDSALELTGPVDVADNLRQILTEEIGALCVSLAKSTYEAGKRMVNLTQNGFFTFQVCAELVKRCGLNPAINIVPWGSLLRDELIACLVKSSHKSSWGLVVVLDDEIAIILEEYVPFWDPEYIRKQDEELFKELDS